MANGTQLTVAAFNVPQGNIAICCDAAMSFILASRNIKVVFLQQKGWNEQLNS